MHVERLMLFKKRADEKKEKMREDALEEQMKPLKEGLRTMLSKKS